MNITTLFKSKREIRKLSKGRFSAWQETLSDGSSIILLYYKCPLTVRLHEIGHAVLQHEGWNKLSQFLDGELAAWMFAYDKIGRALPFAKVGDVVWHAYQEFPARPNLMFTRTIAALEKQAIDCNDKELRSYLWDECLVGHQYYKNHRTKTFYK